MQKRTLIRLVIFVIALLALALPALAHEEREIGEYDVEFGWRNEPAYSGLFNGPEVFINLDEAPISDDVEINLQAEVSFGDQIMTVTFEPAWGETGHFIADLIPTLPGDYSFHLMGTIGDTEVDELFTSADGQFGTVEPLSDILFPPVESDTDARIADLEARIAALEEQLAALQEGL
jgi:hypothetical protein